VVTNYPPIPSLRLRSVILYLLTALGLQIILQYHHYAYDPSFCNLRPPWGYKLSSNTIITLTVRHSVSFDRPGVTNYPPNTIITLTVRHSVSFDRPGVTNYPPIPLLRLRSVILYPSTALGLQIILQYHHYVYGPSFCIFRPPWGYKLSSNTIITLTVRHSVSFDRPGVTNFCLLIYFVCFSVTFNIQIHTGIM